MSGWAIAVDIGGTSTKFGLVSGAGEVEEFQRIRTEPPASLFLHHLRLHIQELLLKGKPVDGIGIAVAGFIDAAHSMMIYNPNIPWLERAPLRSAFAEHFKIPMDLDVDSNAAALGEYRFGEGAGCRRFLCLTVGTGIGGGLVVDRQLTRLSHECIGDVGHVIVEPGGRRCTCGGLGCAEAVATAPAIVEKSRKPVTLEELAVSARKGDRPSQDLFSEAGMYLGELAASLAAIFFPERIALGGGVCDASELVLENAKAAFKRSAGDFVRHTSSIVPARLGANAALIGAACPLLPSASR